MPNKRYLAGRNFEYKVRKDLLEDGYKAVIRASGSHGLYDLVALDDSARPLLLQCKITKTLAQANKLLDKWGQSPPLAPSTYYMQELHIYVRENKTIVSEVI